MAVAEVRRVMSIPANLPGRWLKAQLFFIVKTLAKRAEFGH